MEYENDRKGNCEEIENQGANVAGYTPTLEVEVDEYQAYLDDPNISDDQKAEMIEILWSIVVNFVDMGFGIHPVQEVTKNQQIKKIEQEKNEVTKDGC